MKRISAFILFALAMIVAGCNKGGDGAPVLNSSRDVRFSADINRFAVRATDNAFENDDEIGIFAGAPLSKSNVKATVAGSAVVVDEANPIKWLEGQTDPVAFVAYYPYRSGVSNAAAMDFDVTIDQSDAANYANVDLMVANVTANPPADESDPAIVNLNFKHVLSKIVVKVDNQLASAVTKVELTALSTYAQFNLNDGGAIVDGTIGAQMPSINALKCADEGTKNVFQLLTVPQTAQPQIKVTVEDGTVYFYSLASTFTFAKGKKYTAEIAITEETVAGAVSFTLQVTDWEDADENPSFGGQETIVTKDKWSLIGKIMGTYWNKDFVMTDNHDDSWSIDITYAEGDQFKFRYNGVWGGSEYGMWNNVEPFVEYKTIDPSWIEATTDENPTYGLADQNIQNCNIALPEAGDYTLRLVTFGEHAGDFYVFKK